MDEVKLFNSQNELVQEFIEKLKNTPQFTTMLLSHQIDMTLQTQNLLVK